MEKLLQYLLGALALTYQLNNEVKMNSAISASVIVIMHISEVTV